MKIFNLQYSNKENIGTATVEAYNAKQATIILQSYGRLNASKYRVHAITEIGCNNHSVEKIISESYGIESCGTTSSSNININSLTNEDINNLKLRINKYTGTLYVDRIGKCFREKAEDGHTVFYRSPKPSDYNIDGNIFVKKDGVYQNLGYPSKYKFIESPKKRIKADYDFSKLDKGKTALKRVTELERFHKRIGVFIRYSKGGHGGKKQPRNRFPSWKFLYEIDQSTSKEYVMTRVKNHLADYIKSNSHIKMTINRERNIKRKFYKFAIGEMKKKIGYSRKRVFKLKGTPLSEFTIIREER